jgi:hypothetical protein
VSSGLDARDLIFIGIPVREPQAHDEQRVQREADMNVPVIACPTASQPCAVASHDRIAAA